MYKLFIEQKTLFVKSNFSLVMIWMQHSYLFYYCIARSDMSSELNVAHGVSKTIWLVAESRTVE